MTPEQEREQALRQLAGHERASRQAWTMRVGMSAGDKADRMSERARGHDEAARYLREKYGLAAPQTPPSYEAIKAEWTALGLDPIIKDFWQFHAGQDHPGVGKRNYELAFERVRAAAILAAGSHKRDRVWIPLRVPCGAPMKFIAVTPGTPKGERDYSQSHYKPVEVIEHGTNP